VRLALLIRAMSFFRVGFMVPFHHSINWRSVMTLKLLAPLALLLGILGGGVSGARMSCCAPDADCCNPPQACCFSAGPSVKAADCCPGGDCCDPSQECCGFVSTKVKAGSCCDGGDCCYPPQECCGACRAK
jgi:hypothetical protein